jgi:hypothetical protein
MDYEPMNFSDLAETELGRRLWAKLNEEKSVWAMEVASKLRRPAVEPLGDDLLAEFGNVVRKRRIKQMIGHMARQIMEAHGYELAAQRIPIRFSRLFSTASRYQPARRKGRHV